MPSKKQTHRDDAVNSKQRPPKPTTENLDILAQQQPHAAKVVQQARFDPGSLTPHDVLQLQRMIGNQATGHILAGKQIIQRQDDNPVDRTSVAFALGGKLGHNDISMLMDEVGATKIRYTIGTNMVLNYLDFVEVAELAEILKSKNDTDLRELKSRYFSYGKEGFRKYIKSVPLPEGNPVAPAMAGTSIHPDLGKTGGIGGTGITSRGIAVEELQEKLNHWYRKLEDQKPETWPPRKKNARQIPITGNFDDATEEAVKEFQKANSLAASGVVTRRVWSKFDELKLASSKGFVSKQWREKVGNVTYEMSQANGLSSKYSWQITDTELVVTVGIEFQGVFNPGVVAAVLNGIKNVWNCFKIVNRVTGDSRDLKFQPRSGVGPGHNKIKLKAGSGRSDAGNWYIGDADLATKTGPHEFGHMIGLEDEYQRSHTDYTRLTGEEPELGPQLDPNVIADLFHTELHVVNENARVHRAKAFITRHGLTQGGFAEAVAQAYQEKFGIAILDDIVNRIPATQQWSIVDPFTHSNQTLMGEMGNVDTAKAKREAGQAVPLHEHPVQPRHVREFVSLVAAYLGDTDAEGRTIWEAQYK